MKNTIERQRNIKILMKDGCTYQEAERHLDNGSVVFDSYDEYIQMELDNGADEDEIHTAEELKELYFDGLTGVEYNGNLYIVMYCL